MVGAYFIYFLSLALVLLAYGHNKQAKEIRKEIIVRLEELKNECDTISFVNKSTSNTDRTTSEHSLQSPPLL